MCIKVSTPSAPDSLGHGGPVLHRNSIESGSYGVRTALHVLRGDTICLTSIGIDTLLFDYYFIAHSFKGGAGFWCVASLRSFACEIAGAAYVPLYFVPVLSPINRVFS